MSDEIPELTDDDFAGAISSRLRRRLMQGKFESGGDVVALRKLVRLTQEQFAEAIGISPHTLRNWEQDRRKPEGPALALLRIAARHPLTVRENVRAGIASSEAKKSKAQEPDTQRPPEAPTTLDDLTETAPEQTAELGARMSTDYVEHVYVQFSRTFLGGVPLLLNDGGAFLSFICILSGTEGLAGFRFPEIDRNGERFTRFIRAYYPIEYRPLADDLWRFRNSLVHAFSPGPFAMCHHQANVHLAEVQHGGNRLKRLNAENFYAALVHASSVYFTEVRSSAELQQRLWQRLSSEKGGAPTIIVVDH
jgi:DNA-binding transcriptional regulator YiaG